MAIRGTIVFKSTGSRAEEKAWQIGSGSLFAKLISGIPIIRDFSSLYFLNFSG